VLARCSDAIRRPRAGEREGDRVGPSVRAWATL